MLHEVLFALVGCQSDIIRQTPTECILAPGVAERFLHPGEVELICKLCRLGFYYAALDRFVQVRVAPQLEALPSLYLLLILLLLLPIASVSPAVAPTAAGPHRF